MKERFIIIILLSVFSFCTIKAQHSVAREWNEQLLEAIRSDFARPTIHARNLFHISAAMYDAWAAYVPTADTYFLGKNIDGYRIPFGKIILPENIKEAQEEAISFAAYRLIKSRFRRAPTPNSIVEKVDSLMYSLGYDIGNESTDYLCGPAELGNYIAQRIIGFGMQDGSNEINDYANEYYFPFNSPLLVTQAGNPNIINLDRWQPLEFNVFVDQSGNSNGERVPEFLSPEWGAVVPFSLNVNAAENKTRNGYTYRIFHDPGRPPTLETSTGTELDNLYKWGHTLVAIWSSHLDSDQSTLWDISPASLGNISSYPTDFSAYSDFYNLYEGGDNSQGHLLNPKTGLPYQPNVVKRSDYARVLAEFWADGPDSETPPGHWFTILNTVNDHPQLVKKIEGKGNVLDDLEWDVKTYFILGGAMHDAAIAAWGIKGWYDYVRPISAIRAMADFGQSSNIDLPSYHPDGLPLLPGYVELVESGDPLVGSSGQNIGKIKIFTWKGPRFVTDPEFEEAGVGWILAENWWPYQRPSFVTPPFAGYVSGHSTFSRAAAEVLTMVTGDSFFPGGIGEFYCPRNEFLVFEEGPSEDITLQWATYRDASDQCSLSRIWGGIHPPCDDIPGRLIGERVGIDAFNFALPYFSKVPEVIVPQETNVFPNPTPCGVTVHYVHEGDMMFQVYQSDGKLMMHENTTFVNNQTYIDLGNLSAGLYVLIFRNEEGEEVFKNKIILQ